MKKITTRPDGSKEEIEGTAEEIAAYEDAHAIASAGRAIEPLYCVPKLRPHAEYCPCAGAWWSIVPPVCTCGADPVRWIPRTITYTGTSVEDFPLNTSITSDVSTVCYDEHSNMPVQQL